MIQTVSLDTAPVQAWRNGGGSTRELLVWPRADAWHCRISVAEIGQDGPFSAYPGVERWFAVLRGEGVVLRFARCRHRLTPGSAALRFDGAAGPDCELLAGTSQDLNLMVQSDAGCGCMQRVQPGADWISAAPLRALFTLAGATLQIDGSDAAQLPAGSLTWGEHAAHQCWRVAALNDSAQAWWLQFKPHTA